VSVAPASRLTGHAAALAETHLLRGLPEDQLLELAPLFFRRELPAGVTLFREGDPGRSMLILHSGAVEVARRLPGRELALAAVGATEALGEMALVSGQPRSATVRTTLPTVAYELEAGTFARLRSDGRPVAVELIRRIGEGAVRRLRERTVGIARSLEEQVGMGPPRLGPSQPARLHAAASPETDADYLAGILFFQGLTPAAVAEFTSGLQQLDAERGALVVHEGERPRALLLILRGALETTIRRAERVQRLRLAGPGRAAAHLGVIDPGSSPVTVRARERSVLLEVPRERLHKMVNSPTREDRILTAALHTDVVLALYAAQRPMPEMLAADWDKR